MTEKSFTHDDQLAFARLSGDYNPLHVDPVAARRLLFGRQVVHGIHLLLWALDNWLEEQPEPVILSRLKVKFPAPVLIDEKVVCQSLQEDDHSVSIKLARGGKNVASFSVSYKPDNRVLNSIAVPDRKPGREVPRVCFLEDLVNDSGKINLCLDTTLASSLFSHAARKLPAIQFAEILAVTFLIGMKCPGLHSIYSETELSFELHPELAPELKYEVSKVDKRFALVIIHLTAPWLKGKINAFMRPAPQEQISIADMVQVDPAEFSGQRALIIGGSRGLGEVTAKLLAAGGADIKITYYRGAEDAQRVVEDARASERFIECFPFDILNPSQDLKQCLGKEWVPTHLYYYATPHIGAAPRGTFSPELFRRFCDYYVTGFINTAKAVQSLGPHSLQIVYPSTVFIEELPSNMGEYAAAKMAGETLCTFLEKHNPGLRIHKCRLPRLATDQTRSLMPVKTGDPVPVLLEILREIRSGSF